MADSKDRRDSEKDPYGVSSFRKLSPPDAAVAPAPAPTRERCGSRTLPFAKSYNDDFCTVYEIRYTIQSRARDAYKTYVRAVQDAMTDGNAEALQAAVDQFRAAWPEVSRPGAGVAFDTYQRETTAASGAVAAGDFDPATLALVAHSMAGVASHHLAYRRP